MNYYSGDLQGHIRLETARHPNRKWSGTEINGLAVWDRNKRCLLTFCCCCCPKDDSFGDTTKETSCLFSCIEFEKSVNGRACMTKFLSSKIKSLMDEFRLNSFE